MNGVDYARIHWNVAIKVWCDSPNWTGLFPTYPHDSERRMDAESVAYDLAVSEAHRTDWRTVQEIRWSDALHRTLLKSVAY